MNKILLADEDKWIRLLYSEELIEEGYEVFSTGDSSQVREMIVRRRPDILLLDAKLGRPDGLKLLQSLRRCYRSLPIILITTCPYSRYDTRTRAADFCVIKRSDQKELKLIIMRALQNRKRLSAGTVNNTIFQ